MTAALTLDSSHPYQTGEDILALWLPRGRGRDALASGLAVAVDVCQNPSCPCTIARLHAVPIDDRAERAQHDDGRLTVTWENRPNERPHPEGSAQLTLDILTGVVESKDGEELPP